MGIGNVTEANFTVKLAPLTLCSTPYKGVTDVFVHSFTPLAPKTCLSLPGPLTTDLLSLLVLRV
jgi:hypothetical protein